MPLRFKPRILVLPLAALIIAGLIWYKVTQPKQVLTFEDIQSIRQRRPAPTFKLHDQESQPFRLDRYLGRHKLLIVFFDPTDGADKNAQLQILKDGYAQLTARGEKVIAISYATPYANREAFKRGGDFPFHVLSDADYSVATRWGCMTADDPPRIISSAFVVDRASVISWSQIGGKSPIPLDALLRQLHRAR